MCGGDVCGDNRFEVIEAAKKYIIGGTNIKSSPKEMEVLDSILFRFWQLGLLNKFDPESNEFKWKGATWYKYCECKPPIDIEVIAFNHKWINEDFNPRGTRVGFRTYDEDFISAYWWDYQDDYVSIAKWKYAPDDVAENIEPEWWTPIPDFKAINTEL